MSSHRIDGLLGRASEYASAKDFCGIFRQYMDVLYWLALALTADAGKAEQCFVAGLDECMAGNAVFREWAHSWSKRVVIKNAIRLISPRPGILSPPPSPPQAAGAPKKAAAQAIEALEKDARGWYGGAVGMISLNGDINTGIVEQRRARRIPRHAVAQIRGVR